VQQKSDDDVVDEPGRAEKDGELEEAPVALDVREHRGSVSCEEKLAKSEREAGSRDEEQVQQPRNAASPVVRVHVEPSAKSAGDQQDCHESAGRLPPEFRSFFQYESPEAKDHAGEEEELPVELFTALFGLCLHARDGAAPDAFDDSERDVAIG